MYRKESVSEDTDIDHRRPAPGVLATLAGRARDVREANPDCTRMVLATSIQGNGQLHPAIGGTADTAAHLATFLRHHADSDAGLCERQRFGIGSPTVVVTIDEIAGDPAGTPFVHTISPSAQLAVPPFTRAEQATFQELRARLRVRQ